MRTTYTVYGRWLKARARIFCLTGREEGATIWARSRSRKWAMPQPEFSCRRSRGSALAGTLVLLVLVDGSSRAQSPPSRAPGQPEFLRTTMRLESLVSVTPNEGRYDVSPDWTLLAAPKDDGTVLLFDPASGRPLPSLEGGFGVGTLTYFRSDFSPGSYFGFSADGRFLVWQWGKKVVVWDVPAREVVLRRELEGLLGNGTVRVSPDGHLLAWSTSKGLTLWDVARGTAEDLPAKDVHAFSADGRLLALANVPPQSRVGFRDAIPSRKAIWDVGLKGPRGTYEGLCLGFSPDGRFLLTTVWGGMRGGIRIWDVGTSTPRVLSPDEWAHAAAWSPEGRFLALLDSNLDAEVWDLQAEPPARRVLPPIRKKGSGGHWGRCVTFDGDGRRMDAGERDDPHLLLGPGGRFLCDSCLVTDVWVLSGETPELAVRAGLPRAARHGPGSRPTGRPALSRDGRTLAYTSSQGLALWDVASGTPLGSPIKLDGPGAIEFSPDGALVAVAGGGRAPDGRKANVVQVWDVAAIRAAAAPR